MRTFSTEKSDGELIRTAAQLVQNAQRLQPRYARGPIPASTAEVANLLRRAACKVYLIDARPGAKAITTPPIDGRYRIGIKRHLTFEERAFALRHELGHVIAGDADEPVAMVDRGYLTYAERYADLFALADLIPGRLIETLRRARLSWRDIRAEIETEIRERWGPDWPWARVDDRSVLRLRLYREHGI